VFGAQSRSFVVWSSRIMRAAERPADPRTALRWRAPLRSDRAPGRRFSLSTCAARALVAVFSTVGAAAGVPPQRRKYHQIQKRTTPEAE
jgi:hypothetical protein